MREHRREIRYNVEENRLYLACHYSGEKIGEIKQLNQYGITLVDEFPKLCVGRPFVADICAEAGAQVVSGVPCMILNKNNLINKNQINKNRVKEDLASDTDFDAGAEMRYGICLGQLEETQLSGIHGCLADTAD